MQIAQRLYEGVELGPEGSVGLITYMRTDSTRMSDDALREIRSYVEAQYGKPYLPEKPNRYRAKKRVQDAHEAIRPTSMEQTPEKVRRYLRRDAFALYSLIWERAVASQMPPAVYDQTGFNIEVAEGLFRATGQQLKFDGFMRLYIEGKDEVAELARSFNRSADRIERLVEAQRHVLASVSHEIRTPLARMRVALELLESENRPELREQLMQDIADLDDLIGELLLASRLDTIDQFEHTEDIDLLALLAEESARTGADVSGEPVTIHGDPRMLRRLIRNLLENAQKYAGDTTVEAVAAPGTEGGAILSVSDRGPGVPEDERERIFEPFYRSRQTPEHDRSVGLGLALVRRIADRHGGSVRCLARDGGGTTFEVSIPAID